MILGQKETFKMDFNNQLEAEQIIRLALGRLFKIGSRQFREGDIEEFEKCKWLILDADRYIKSLKQ